jgi:hypothetical protein
MVKDGLLMLLHILLIGILGLRLLHDLRLIRTPRSVLGVILVLLVKEMRLLWHVLLSLELLLVLMRHLRVGDLLDGVEYLLLKVEVGFVIVFSSFSFFGLHRAGVDLCRFVLAVVYIHHWLIHSVASLHWSKNERLAIEGVRLTLISLLAYWCRVLGLCIVVCCRFDIGQDRLQDLGDELHLRMLILIDVLSYS